MKKLQQLSIILLSSLVMYSCTPLEAIDYVSPEKDSSLVQIEIYQADDETGLVYGITEEKLNAETTYFKVTAPYKAITYDSTTHIHYIDMNMWSADDTNWSIEVFTYRLAGISDTVGVY